MNEKVALVSMPFASLSHPGIGISLLQAGLRERSVPCDIYYFNLLFGSALGFDLYCQLGELSPPSALIGDWIFAHCVFGERMESDKDYVASFLQEQYGDYFDFGLTLKALEARDRAQQLIEDCLKSVRWDEYAIVGFTTSYQQNVASLALAKRLKESYPDLKIVFGGANCETEMGVQLHKQFNFIDFVCSGEGDLAFPELVSRLFAGQDVTMISGMITRSGNETTIPQQLTWPVHDVDALPYPNYDDYFGQLKAARLDYTFEPLIPFESSRGCWWGAKLHCTFCGLNGSTMAYRSKSPDRALEEVLQLAEKYGKNILAVDNIFDLKYLNSFFPDLATLNLGLTFHYETKVNLKKSQLKLLREAGVTHLQPGIESLSTNVLRLMKKGCNLLQNIQCLKWGKEYGLDIAWNFLYGFPGEDPADYLRMSEIIPSLAHLEPPVGCGKVRMDRHSPYFMQPGTYGLENVRPQDAYQYVYPLGPNVLAQIAYYFDFDCDGRESTEQYAAAALDQIRAWQSASDRGQLLAFDDGETLTIEDTRDSEIKISFRLEEPARSLYLFCDEAKSLAEIEAFLITLPDYDATTWFLRLELETLLSQRLMVSDASSFLSLAIIRSGSTDISGTADGQVLPSQISTAPVGLGG